jgi:hypothetical protein
MPCALLRHACFNLQGPTHMSLCVCSVVCVCAAVFDHNCLKLHSVMQQYPSVAVRPHVKVRDLLQGCSCCMKQHSRKTPCIREASATWHPSRRQLRHNRCGTTDAASCLVQLSDVDKLQSAFLHPHTAAAAAAAARPASGPQMSPACTQAAAAAGPLNCGRVLPKGVLQCVPCLLCEPCMFISCIEYMSIACAVSCL